MYAKILKSVPVHRVAIVRSFADLFADAGTPLDKALRRARLPVSGLDAVDHYLPSQRFFEFVLDTAAREGIDDVGFRVGQRVGANGADPKLVGRLRAAPTLQRAIGVFSNLTNKTVTHSHVGVEPSPNDGYLRFYHRPSCDVRHPVHAQIAWFGLVNLVGVVRTIAGPDWQPPEIGVMMGSAPSPLIRKAFPHARIRLQQPFSYIALDPALLGLAGEPPAARAVAPAELDFFEPFDPQFPGALEQLLTAYARDHRLSVGMAAELFNTSPRTLQRRLQAAGTRFSDVVDRVNFAAARTLLGRPGMTVADVARKLRYSDPTHFARAFRRVAGVSPSAFRQRMGGE